MNVDVLDGVNRLSLKNKVPISKKIGMIDFCAAIWL